MSRRPSYTRYTNWEAAPISRRCFSRLLFGSLLAFAPLPAFADPVPADDPLPAGLRHDQAVTLLRRGRTFLKAAEFLESAARKEPNNPQHQMALGCAYAGRTASLAHAAAYSEALAVEWAAYNKRLKVWETERDKLRVQETLPPEYESTRPRSPQSGPFLIKDDGVPYKLSVAQANAELNELAAKALSAWKNAISLAKTPEEKGQAYYIQGWGMRLLLKFLENDLSDSSLNIGWETSEDENAPPPAPRFVFKKLPKNAEVLASFEKAIEAVPDTSAYWQAKGDVLRLDGSDEESDPQRASRKKSVQEAYRKAAELGPENAASLWYLMYEQYAQNSSSNTSSDWDSAREYLEKAAARDRGNAWPIYEEASILFRQAPFSLTGPSESPDATPAEKKAHRDAVRNTTAHQKGRRAIDFILQGNATPHYAIPRYQPNVPTWLAVAWKYDSAADMLFPSLARFRELARAGSGYATFLLEDDSDLPEALRAVNAVIEMGKKVCGDWPVKEDILAGKTVIQTLVGIAIAAIGYKAQIKVYDMVGDNNGKTSAQAEYDAFQQKSNQYRKLWQAQFETTDYSTLY